MPIRVARYSDLDQIVNLLAASFSGEELHDHIFPYRRQYPVDYLRAWRQKIAEWWWDYDRLWVVNYETVDDEARRARQPERLTGVAQWHRAGLGTEMVWGVRWWDPRRLIVKLVTLYNIIQRSLFTNRAERSPSITDPVPLNKWNFGPSMWPFVSHHFTEPPYRRNHWELSVLGVHPDFHKRSIGRSLVAWGLQRARSDGVPAVVIGAKGTENFYQRCGFELYVGACPDQEYVESEAVDRGTEPSRIRNPLRVRNLGGGAIMWTRVKEDE